MLASHFHYFLNLNSEIPNSIYNKISKLISPQTRSCWENMSIDSFRCKFIVFSNSKLFSEWLMNASRNLIHLEITQRNFFNCWRKFYAKNSNCSQLEMTSSKTTFSFLFRSERKSPWFVLFRVSPLLTPSTK